MSTPPRPGAGVDAALAEMQRKLAELQTQLAGADLPRDPARVPGAAPPAPVELAPTILPPAVAGSLGAYAPPQGPAATTVPLPPVAPPLAGPPGVDAEEQARMVVTEAQLTAGRMIEDAQARVNGMRAQIDQLLEIRSNLLQSARGLLTEYDAALRHLEASESLPATHDPVGPVLHSAEPPRAGFSLPPVADPSAGGIVPAPTPAPATPSTPVPAPGGGRVYEGRVVVEAGPFADIATLSSFEQALGRLPGAEDVYVRGFADDRAMIDLSLNQPLDLAATLAEALPFRFEVAASDADRITLRVQSGS